MAQDKHSLELDVLQASCLYSLLLGLEDNEHEKSIADVKGQLETIFEAENVEYIDKWSVRSKWVAGSFVRGGIYGK